MAQPISDKRRADAKRKGEEGEDEHSDDEEEERSTASHTAAGCGDHRWRSCQLAMVSRSQSTASCAKAKQ